MFTGGKDKKASGVPVRGKTMYDALAETKADLATIEELGNLGKYPGWIKLAGGLQERIDIYQGQQNDLCKDPVGNAVQIMEINALREAYQGLIDMFETPLEAQGELEERKEYLNKKIQEANREQLNG